MMEWLCVIFLCVLIEATALLVRITFHWLFPGTKPSGRSEKTDDRTNGQCGARCEYEHRYRAIDTRDDQ